VLVASIRALKMHGGVAMKDITKPNLDALQKGFANLDKHIENLNKFGVPVVVAINNFASDTVQEIEMVTNHCKELGVRHAVSQVYAEGGKGGRDLAEQVLDVLSNQEPDFRFLYDEKLPIKEKIRIIATEIYGARDVRYIGNADRDIRSIEESGNNELPICMAKTQYSITDDPKLKGAPRNWTLTVKEVYASAGAGFIVPLCGDVTLIPGLPKEPAALRMDITDDGRIIGLS
jgi:formate--tetrahydrofolate ligase